MEKYICCPYCPIFVTIFFYFLENVPGTAHKNSNQCITDSPLSLIPPVTVQLLAVIQP